MTDKQIRALLRAGYSPQQVADEHHLPIKRIARAQSHGTCAHDPARPRPEPVGFRLARGVALAESPTLEYAPYWQEWDAAHKPQPRPRRTVRMVPDDRRDEFDDLVIGTAAALSMGAREGRGAA